MYETFYGFSEKPFALTPDPTFLFLGSRKHATGLSLLQYGLLNRAGISVLTGAVGAGKTTLVRQLLNEVGSDVSLGLISNTHESFGNLMQWIAVAYELPARASSKAILYDRFTRYLIEQYASGRRVVLIVDEAQNLSARTLEELRLLTNVNADKDQLLQLILVGQPELRARLNSPGLEQFVQRIGVDYHLTEMSLDESLRYIEFRLARAGGPSGLFDATASRFIHYQCAGTPRLINSMCDTALVYGFATHEKKISCDLVYHMVCERIRAGLFAAAGTGGGGTKCEVALQEAAENLLRARSESEHRIKMVSS